MYCLHALEAGSLVKDVTNTKSVSLALRELGRKNRIVNDLDRNRRGSVALSSATVFFRRRLFVCRVNSGGFCDLVVVYSLFCFKECITDLSTRLKEERGDLSISSRIWRR
jgi:hypothetical protein